MYNTSFHGPATHFAYVGTVLCNYYYYVQDFVIIPSTHCELLIDTIPLLHLLYLDQNKYKTREPVFISIKLLPLFTYEF